uniref:Uncharacterized protein n=1 Tax=Triticum urartu TaxID=4572 RepID=A0A8R7PI52_TRIUA
MFFFSVPCVSLCRWSGRQADVSCVGCCDVFSSVFPMLIGQLGSSFLMNRDPPGPTKKTNA